VEEAVEAAAKIGYENGVMIKASEGGGGKGIRFVDNEADLRNAYVQVQNEVVGSPIFLMQLCKNARHLEVQIVGDQHGNAVALNGRDCSTQRRFQKIFEEGPPIIAPRETFREMEKAAQRLTQSIGYIGAGTVEYLFNADTGKFFFLELNPRLQVEHPVTEGISLVNLPATQLQVAMGIPLFRMPEIRKFYGLDREGDSKIDFLEQDYNEIDSHVIAARITAENPDEGFKPTSGTIERIKFQSTSNVWGYFSVGANGGIHEFADSQFGHLFAKGPTREHARKSLVLALKEIEVRGEIRTTVEYLVQLLETDDFKQNTIDTAWLDGILSEQTVYVQTPPHLVVLCAAAFRSFEHINEASGAIIESFQKGQTSVTSIGSTYEFPMEISYEDTRYSFLVTRLAADIFRFRLNNQEIDVKIRMNPEGALLATFAGETHRILGFDEPLGLRISIDGVTILMPTIFDPSELRTDVTGKVVRYLQDNGAEVQAGEPYVEVEAMKMIMPIKATESGAIQHALSPGSIISAGDMLASLTLRDPSKVKKIVQFSEELSIDSTVSVLGSPEECIGHALAGFDQDVESITLQALNGLPLEEAANLVSSTISAYLDVESQFENRILDDVVQDMIKANKDNLQEVIDLNLAHSQLKSRNKLILALLRQVETFRDRYDGIEALPAEMKEKLRSLAALKGHEYGEIVLSASSIIRESEVPSFSSRLEDLRATLSSDVDKVELSRSATLSAGVDLLSALFNDADEKVREKAVEVYVRRVYRAHRIVDIDVKNIDGRLTCSWKFQFADTPIEESPIRVGQMSVIKDQEALKKQLPDILDNMKSSVSSTESSSDRTVNVLHLALSDSPSTSGDDSTAASYSELLSAYMQPLNELKLRSTNILIPTERRNPKYFTFAAKDDYKEDPLRRNMRPTFHHLLELGRLRENHSLSRMAAVGKNAQVYLGEEVTSKPTRGGPQQVVFVRALSHSKDVATPGGAFRALVQGLDELENAAADPAVKSTASSRIFLHSLPELHVTPEEALESFRTIMEQIKSKYATRLLKLNVDEIEVKLRLTGDKSTNGVKPIRLIASSMSGEWLKLNAFVEFPDPITGVTGQFCTIGGEEPTCTLDPYGTSNIVQTKRAIARRVGSTYAYDFLGLLEVSLIGEWESHLKSINAVNVKRSVEGMPSSIFKSEELLLDAATGEIVKGSRDIGTNDIGMVAWMTTMKTPEYPSGRQVIFVANDVTFQSGSFGVREDEFYFKVSEYARELKIPRVYIACNAGARIGLVDELKPQFQVKFTDPNNPSKGYDYLYLSDEDYRKNPSNTVNAVKCEEGWRITDIIGSKHGIGVENLRGSGMIAGETSRAYSEIFTLSYVTGRSVGIGAYIVRLGQRVIQMKQGPLILTGYSALNKLLGKDVYTSQDQLGGPQVMFPNGVAHQVVEDDQAGVGAILKWLSYVPKDANSLPAVRETSDPIDRPVEFTPTKTPYDPRHMLAGDGNLKGFFDDGSFTESLAGWGKSVVTGRARLGGIPVGVIAVETRMVEQRIPADPANPDSRESILPQAGQVWFPDSSYKTAQAVRDFGTGENLPLVIFANWRGFSGGTRDMAGEILKFGSMIVDALREYQHPVFVYIPPHGELRGGSWVVIDPTINIDQMEMYADEESRGGILEPAGIIEVKFRAPEQLKVMHRLDTTLQQLDSDLEHAVTESDAIDIKSRIKEREDLLAPLYTQIATEFADLHDRSGRMKAKEVIRDVVSWKTSREYFHYRIKRRVIQDSLLRRIKTSDKSLSNKEGVFLLKSLFNGSDWENDKAVLDFFEENQSNIDVMIGNVRKEFVKRQIEELQKEL